MGREEEQQILSNIFARAENGESTDIHLISYWEEYRYYAGEYKATKLIIKMLKDTVKRLTNAYCKGVLNGTADVNILLAYVQVDKVLDFYKTERKILISMLDEYEIYLQQGNFLRALFGEVRDV
jgi:hypothetical protein